MKLHIILFFLITSILHSENNHNWTEAHFYNGSHVYLIKREYNEKKQIISHIEYESLDTNNPPLYHRIFKYYPNDSIKLDSIARFNIYSYQIRLSVVNKYDSLGRKTFYTSTSYVQNNYPMISEQHDSVFAYSKTSKIISIGKLDSNNLKRKLLNKYIEFFDPDDSTITKTSYHFKDTKYEKNLVKTTKHKIVEGKEYLLSDQKQFNNNIWGKCSIRTKYFYNSDTSIYKKEYYYSTDSSSGSDVLTIERNHSPYLCIERLKKYSSQNNIKDTLNGYKKISILDSKGKPRISITNNLSKQHSQLLQHSPMFQLTFYSYSKENRSQLSFTIRSWEKKIFSNKLYTIPRIYKKSIFPLISIRRTDTNFVTQRSFYQDFELVWNSINNITIYKESEGENLRTKNDSIEKVTEIKYYHPLKVYRIIEFVYMFDHKGNLIKTKKYSYRERQNNHRPKHYGISKYYYDSQNRLKERHNYIESEKKEMVHFILDNEYGTHLPKARKYNKVYFFYED